MMSFFLTTAVVQMTNELIGFGISMVIEHLNDTPRSPIIGQVS